MTISSYRWPIRTAGSRRSASRPSKTPSYSNPLRANPLSLSQAMRRRLPPILHLTLTFCATAIVLGLLVPGGERWPNAVKEAPMAAKTCSVEVCDHGSLLLTSGGSTDDTADRPVNSGDGL